MTDQARVDVIKRVTDAFNRHDLDAIMSAFSEDCVFESPRGRDPWGTRFAGRAAVRSGFAQRFDGIPDVHYADGTHVVCGERGFSEWTLTGTAIGGERIEVRGCDLWTFDADDRISRKDSYWKIRAV